MRFHRGTLSEAGLNPWAMTVISAARECEKIPSVVAVVCLSPSICHRLKCWGISSNSPLTPPHPFITPFSLYISAFHPSSTHPSIHPPIHALKCLSLHFHRASPSTPPPPSALVATETADSGRVGGCLRAHAALPHAVLSQDISASVLLLWPWYADSSGGWATNLLATQRLFVCSPRRMPSGLNVTLLFIIFLSRFGLVRFFSVLKEGRSQPKHTV